MSTESNNMSASREDVLTHGITRVFHVDHPYAVHIEEIYFKGFTVIPEVLDGATIADLSEAIDRVYEFQVGEIGGKSYVEAMDDAYNIRCPLAYDDRFVSLAKNPIVLGIVREIMGYNFILMMQNAIINHPTQGNHQTRWHRDLNYQHWVSSTPLILNALFTIDEFTPQTGCTHALPGTHLREEFPSDAYVVKHQVPAIATAGSVILMNSMMFHRAGQNLSEKPRRAVNHVIGRPFMAQQIDIPGFVGDRLAVDEFSRNYFGYRWRPAASPTEWRMARQPKS